MDEQKINKLIQDGIEQNAQKAQYGVNRTPVHTHNGIDSPKIFPTAVGNFFALNGLSGSDGVISPDNIGNSQPPFPIVYPTPLITGYGVLNFAQFNGGNAPQGTTVLFFNEALGVTQLWSLIQAQQTTTFSLTGSLSAGATSATLLAAWDKDNGFYLAKFSNNDLRTVALNFGDTAVAWSGGLTSGVTSDIDITIDAQWYGVDLSQSPSITVNTRYILYRCINSIANEFVGSSVGGTLVMPFDGTITDIGATVDTAGDTGTTQLDVNNNGVSILSTKITIDDGETDSRTATTPPVISTPDFVTGDIIDFDVDTVQTTPAQGLTFFINITQA